MDEVSDLKRDLTSIKDFTDDEGRIKAWVDNIDVKEDKLELSLIHD
jgi:hypothetical protein